MDITEMKDKSIIELTDAVAKPRSQRSKKPVEHWKAGTRFRIRTWIGRHDRERVWEIQEVQRQRYSGQTVNMHGDPDLFLRIIRDARPVEDLAAILAVCNPDAEEILAELIRQSRVGLEEVKAAIVDIDRNNTESDLRKEVERIVGDNGSGDLEQFVKAALRLTPDIDAPAVAEMVKKQREEIVAAARENEGAS